VKRPILQRVLSSRQYVLIGVLPVFYVSLGQCHLLIKAVEKTFGTLPVSPNLQRHSIIDQSWQAYRTGILF
jgi:hypothetical protein